MTAPRARRRFRSVLLSGALCALGFASAAAVPVPDRPEMNLLSREPENAEPLPTAAKPTEVDKGSISVSEMMSTDTVRPRLVNPREVSAALTANYPPLLRDAGISGVVLMEVETDAEGEVVRTRALRATHDALANAARRTLSGARFSPATVEGRAVPYRFSIPVEFALPIVGDRGDLPMISTISRGEMQALQEAVRANSEAVQAAMPEIQKSLEEVEAAQPEIQEALREAAIRAREVARAVADTSRFRSGAFRSGAEAMRVKSRAFLAWSGEWRQGMERTHAAIQSALGRYHPDIAASGTGKDTYVWFMVDGENRILASGTHPLTLDPAERFGGRGAWHTSTVEEELSSAYPRVRIEGLMITRGPIDGKPMNVAWVTLKPDSPAP